MEVHNAWKALIIENASVELGNKKVNYDGLVKFITESTAKGKPDIEAVDMTSRLAMVNDIFEVTKNP